MKGEQALSPDVRGLIEADIDRIVRDAEKFVRGFEASDIEPTDGAMMGYVLGSMEMLMLNHLRLRGEEVTGNHVREISGIVRRRRGEILDALRDALGQ